MSSQGVLTDAFLAGVDRSRGELVRSGAATTPLGSILACGLRSAQRRWPTVHLDPALFAHYWGERIAPDRSLERAAEDVFVEDLYLACGCAMSDETAIAIFEREFISQVPLFVSRQRLPAPALDELKQILRHQLLVVRQGAPPRIAEYAGRGPLGGWVRVSAARAGLNLRRGQPVDARAVDGAGATDPELQLVKMRSADEIKRALDAALGGISPKERTILRLHYVEGIPPDALARMFHVHRTTVVRWIHLTRDQVLEKTRALLRNRLALSDGELDSLIGAARSELDLSISRVLGSFS